MFKYYVLRYTETCNIYMYIQYWIPNYTPITDSYTL